MTRNKTLLILLVSGIIAVIIYVSYRMLHVRDEAQYRSVSVIVDNSNSDRWTAFREGLEQGAAEERIYINVVSTDVFRSVGEEAAVIRKELENGADGLIVQPCRGDVNEQLSGILPETACVLADVGISEETTLDVVRPDWYAMGESAAEQAAQAAAGGKTEHEMRVGILSGNIRQEDMARCLQGAQKRLKERQMDIAWICSGEDIPDLKALEMKYAQEPVQLLLTLDDAMTELAVKYVKLQTKEPAAVFGIGRSEQNIASLDEGWIQALVVPDEYFMGYHCVKILAQKLGYYLARTQTAQVPFVTVAKDDIYDEAVETLLFPVVR